MSNTISEVKLGGRFSFPGKSWEVQRIGYGAMQLAGPGVWGPPKDPNTAVAVLREAVAAGVNHIDTADFYGPHITNQIIRQALHPYPKGLVLVTKVGARRPPDKAWQPAISRQELTDGVHDNLRNLGLDTLEVVNYRAKGAIHGPAEGSIAEQVTALADLKRKGLIRHIGLSNVTVAQLAEAQTITDIVCVQNNYNLTTRHDDALIDDLARQGIAYVPFFPLGGFTPLQSSTLSAVARRLGATPMQVALAWLLHRSPNILLIPGTSSVAHLRENLGAGQLTLSPQIMTELDGIAAATVAVNQPAPEIELLRAAYAAFNARAIDTALALMAPDVAWPRAFKGGLVRGPQAVRAYWTEQWSEIDPRVEPVAFHPEGGGRILVEVHQVVRDLAGSVLADERVGHRFKLEQGLIQSMEVSPLPSSDRPAWRTTKQDQKLRS